MFYCGHVTTREVLVSVQVANVAVKESYTTTCTYYRTIEVNKLSFSFFLSLYSIKFFRTGNFKVSRMSQRYSRVSAIINYSTVQDRPQSAVYNIAH